MQEIYEKIMQEVDGKVSAIDLNGDISSTIVKTSLFS